MPSTNQKKEWAGLSAHGVAVKAIEERNPELVVQYITNLLHSRNESLVEKLEGMKYPIGMREPGKTSIGYAEEDKGYMRAITEAQEIIRNQE